jgi:amyloid beta A4 protein
MHVVSGAAGPFQSDALLVPEHCLFDHVHNQTRCWDFDAWNRTAASACADRGMRVKSFAMLLPCGIDVFSGVEFVCCPAANKNKAEATTTAAVPLPDKAVDAVKQKGPHPCSSHRLACTLTA